MTDTAVSNLVRTTLENPFSREHFLIFAKNLFHFLDTDTFIYRGNLIPDAYEAHIKTLERLGKYEDVDGHKIEVLAVCLNKQSALERARTLQRNFIAWYLNGSRGGVTKDAALVAFYTKDSDDWRLSLVKMDYHLGESKSGKVKAITELTPARRFSFLVGINENTHTAQKQLLPIIKDTEFKPRLTDLESAFSVEVVTKDFFEKYKKLFLDTQEALDKIVAGDAKIKADFQEKNIDTTDFAKKLLGQIVFLYFLQKKGWFGVARDDDWGTGPKDFLRRLFEKTIAPYDNFFNDTLEPLFYEALAVERPDDFYSKFNCKIPFLNGGLFDPLGNYDWVHTDIRLPDELFSNNRRTREGDTGDGILDVFDRYNFTVKEDEPLEREVAVDPEMLGKVFENLLEVKDRKSKGTYYTPREIVHYMCQESLINYLLTELDSKVSRDDIETLIRLGETAIENDAFVVDKGYETKDHHFKLPQSIRDNSNLLDEKLEKIRVCDPAVGSGAFLVGMMTEVIRVRNILTKHVSDNGRSIYDFKRHAIQNCLYGVDIDPGAVEIAKLRLWLSLIVDEQDIKQIKPLPNLDYKIMQGNSLLEEYEGIKLFDEGIVTASPLDNTRQIEDIKQKLSDLQREFFKLHAAGELKGAKKQLIDVELKRYSDWFNKLTKPRKIKVDNGSLFDQDSAAKQKAEDLKRLHKEFFETANKREKDAIKKQIEALEWELIEATLREQNKLSLLPEIERFKKTNIKPFFLWKLNFSEIFEETNGKGGFDVVIANPPYIDSESMVKKDFKTREAILKTYRFTKGNWDIYIAFFELGFRVLNNNGTLTFITPDKWISKPFGEELRKQTISNIYSIVKAGRKIFESAKVDSIVSFFSKISSPNIKILDFQDGSFVPRREVDKKLIKEPFALDFLFSNNLELLLKIEKVNGKLSGLGICENACATSDAYKLAGLIKNLTEVFDEDLYLKVINTGTIGKYFSKWGKQEMTYLGHKYRFPVVEKEEFLKLFKNTYASKSVQKKVIVKGLNLLDACLDKDGNVIPGKSTLIVTSENLDSLKTLLLVVNSKLPFFYIKERYPASSYNQGTSFTKEMISSFPFPKINTQTDRFFRTTADKILVITESDSYSDSLKLQSQVSEYQNQVNQAIYSLYELTPEEIEIVEGGEKQ